MPAPEPVPPLLRHTTARLNQRQLAELHRWMLLTRRLEERLERLHRQGRIPGGLYRSLGQEATSVGAACALEPGDRMGALIRNLGALLARGVRPFEIYCQYLGRRDGPTFGRDGNTHFGDLRRGLVAPISMLGAGIPVLAGMGLAARLRGEDRVALTWIGDGGASTGDFHEGLNLAAVWKLPLILVVENNGWAYSTPTASQTAQPRLVERARGYGVKGERLDGNDVIAVYHAVRRAARRARRGRGPTLLEAVTFRRLGHAQHDAADYVPAEERRQWEARDPLARLTDYLLEEGLSTHARLEEVEEEVEVLLEEEQRAALAAPEPEAALAFGGVYAQDDDPREERR